MGIIHFLGNSEPQWHDSPIEIIKSCSNSQHFGFVSENSNAMLQIEQQQKQVTSTFRLLWVSLASKHSKNLCKLFFGWFFRCRKYVMSPLFSFSEAFSSFFVESKRSLLILITMWNLSFGSMHFFWVGKKGRGFFGVVMGPESWGNGISTPEMPGGLRSDQQRHLHFES